MLIEPLPYHPNPLTLMAALLDQEWLICLDSGGLDRFDIISANPIKKLTPNNTAHTEISTILKNWLPKPINNPEKLPFIGGALGAIGYDNDFAIGYYDWAIITDHQEKTTTYIHENSQSQHWQWLQQQLTTQPRIDAFLLQQEPSSNMARETYDNALSTILNHILAGDCYQVNFAQRFLAETSGHPFYLYQSLREKNPAPYSCYFQTENHTILSASPEQFLTINERTVSTKPIKGTRPRHNNPKQDNALKSDLAHSEKDQAENLMIVDLLRNDLHKCCKPGSIDVPTLFAINSFAGVHHMVSTVTGHLKDHCHPLDCFVSAFPGGSITGAPKERAREIISTLEPSNRHIYCGSIGLLSRDHHLHTNIAIRTLQHHNNQLYYWAGGGIVADSVIADEYEETLTKVRRIHHALTPFLPPSTWTTEAAQLNPPTHWYDWLTQPKRLTRAYQQLCDCVEVTVLSEGFANINAEEAEYCHIDSSQTAWVREVLITGDSIPYEFARVVIPSSTVNAFPDTFEQLGKKPLGDALLYDNPDVTRSDFSYQRISGMACQTHPVLANHVHDFNQPLYARRSLFFIKGYPLSVTETFLPKLPALT